MRASCWSLGSLCYPVVHRTSRMLHPFNSPMPQAVAPCPHAVHMRHTSHIRATPSGRGARCQAQAGLQLEQWQQERLATAYTKGKRHISVSAVLATPPRGKGGSQEERAALQHGTGKPQRVRSQPQIKELSRDVELDRSDVLQYLRELDQLPDRWGQRPATCTHAGALCAHPSQSEHA